MPAINGEEKEKTYFLSLRKILEGTTSERKERKEEKKERDERKQSRRCRRVVAVRCRLTDRGNRYKHFTSFKK